MKKILAILFIFLLTACNGNDAVDQLKENHPEIKEVAEKFPKSIQKN
ncbi:hypothetical protein M3196_01625 [Fictibacillus nanhaiensis]|nr:hypothetical protein [Fictibacillus nanhaiensis]MCM3730366.1 hypothetical protein [Fictibacillus nanhaiensis]